MIIELGKDFGKELENWVTNYPSIKEPPYTVWNVKGNRMRVFDNSTRFIIEEKLNQWSKDEMEFFLKNFIEGYNKGFSEGYVNELIVLEPFVSESLNKRIHITKELLRLFESRMLHYWFSLNEIKIREKAYLNAVITRCKMDIIRAEQKKNKNKDLKPRYSSFDYKGDEDFITRLYEWLFDEEYISINTELVDFYNVFMLPYNAHKSTIQFVCDTNKAAEILRQIMHKFDHMSLKEIERTQLFFDKKNDALKNLRQSKQGLKPYQIDEIREKISEL